MAKYDTIGKTYNKTRKADPYLLNRLYKNLDPQENSRYLDIGCGSGNYTNKLYELGVNIMGIDPSQEMLTKAKLKNPKIDYRIGVAEDIDLPDSSLAGVTAFLTIHHWKDLEKGFQEIGRVLKPGGRFVIFHSTPRQMESYWLNSYFPNMMKNSMRLMPTMHDLEKAFNLAHLALQRTENYYVMNDLQDLFLQCGKNDPEIYFNPEIRAGISSFAAVANEEEVDLGLKKLRSDLDTDNFRTTFENYNDSLGDYLFIIAEKA